ncbi:hypothetical protein ACU5AX_06325 [Sphingomonas sp. XXL09]|uniref:hypothetical protein n=1 Tax=Sphingomonas sp. XXL09 TaxID=3457787 RepID=UPI00406BB3A0
MFFITWGAKTVVIALGSVGVFYCPTCEKDRTFIRWLSYRLWHILWLCRWPVSKTYRQDCELCGRGQELDPAEVEAELGGSPIPLIDRFGWTVAVAIVIALFVIGHLNPRPRPVPADYRVARPLSDGSSDRTAGG